MKKIILSRTDNLGDVVLTLPMAGWIKKHIPGVRIIFLGKAYTRPLIDRCRHIDQFMDWDEMRGDLSAAAEKLKSVGADAIIHVFPDKKVSTAAKKAGIPLRIATTGRIYSWLYSNKLVKLTRRRSELHEAQLNIMMLKPLGIPVQVKREDIPDFYGLVPGPSTPSVAAIPVTGKYRLIIHPKSKGSAREWGTDNFSRFIEMLPADKYEIYVTGTRQEGDLIKDFISRHAGRVNDMTGKFSLDELVSFIASCDGLVAASTGPLHIAAALGKKAIGIYAPMRPIFPVRWAPLGPKAHFLVKDEPCSDCRKSGDCHCIREISPEKVARLVGEM